MTRYPFIIGLNSLYPRAGKDTVAGILRDLYGYEQRAFADKLRAAVLALDPPVSGDPESGYLYLSDVIGIHGWESIKDTVYGPIARRLLRRGGTEMGRDTLGENIWVDAGFNDLVYGDKYVFSDARFPNEYHAIKNAGGQVWRIDRPDIEQDSSHRSDAALAGFDFDAVIVNDGTLSDLSRKVMRLLDPLAAVYQ